MALWRVIALAIAASIFVEAKLHQHQKRDTASNICDISYNNATKIQCYCVSEPRHPGSYRSAECHLAQKEIQPDDISWNKFEQLRNATKLVLANTRGIVLTYIPTNALQLMPRLIKLEIKYSNIEKIDPFAFANLTVIEEITLGDNQVKALAVNAFIHHRDLKTIGLDTNNIVEINRNVFVNLPSLDRLFLTNNRITTIHDKAFVHLINLKELAIDRNNLFSLNSETFSGLKKLEQLDLSGNSLEVIGDNTFLPLTNLKILNLDSNKIQMLDAKAFHGLGNLYDLSLAHNNLTTIENVKIFEGLHALSSLSLKSNKLVELKAEVMAPILNNFYGNSSNLDVEGNEFPCDCRLDWFSSLMNKTQNSHLKLALENLKCSPSDHLRELWTKATEAEKTTGQTFEEEATQTQNADYEYYDEAQLNGKLFYNDLRDLANCTTSVPSAPENVEMTSPKAAGATVKMTDQTIPKITTERKLPSSSPSVKPFETHKEKPKKDIETKESFTTTRLATVSAKPLDHNNLIDQDMASDEARPERIKAHRSVQDEDIPKYNNAHPNISSVVVVTIMLCFRLCV